MTQVSALRRLLMLSECGFSMDCAVPLVGYKGDLPIGLRILEMREFLRARIGAIEYEHRSFRRRTFWWLWKFRVWTALTFCLCLASYALNKSWGELFRGMNLSLPVITRWGLEVDGWVVLGFGVLTFFVLDKEALRKEKLGSYLWQQLWAVRSLPRRERSLVALGEAQGSLWIGLALESARVRGNLERVLGELAYGAEWELIWRREDRVFRSFCWLCEGVFILFVLYTIAVWSPFNCLTGCLCGELG